MKKRKIKDVSEYSKKREMKKRAERGDATLRAVKNEAVEAVKRKAKEIRKEDIRILELTIKGISLYENYFDENDELEFDKKTLDRKFTKMSAHVIPGLSDQEILDNFYDEIENDFIVLLTSRARIRGSWLSKERIKKDWLAGRTESIGEFSL